MTDLCHLKLTWQQNVTVSACGRGPTSKNCPHTQKLHIFFSFFSQESAGVVSPPNCQNNALHIISHRELRARVTDWVALIYSTVYSGSTARDKDELRKRKRGHAVVFALIKPPPLFLFWKSSFLREQHCLCFRSREEMLWYEGCSDPGQRDRASLLLFCFFIVVVSLAEQISWRTGAWFPYDCRRFTLRSRMPTSPRAEGWVAALASGLCTGDISRLRLGREWTCEKTCKSIAF